MRDEQKTKEHAYRLMQRETKQCESLQKELHKLKEAKVSLMRQQKAQAQQMQKLKKAQQLKLTTLKKSDIKKQQQVNSLRSELMKKDRVLGHKDREIGRISSKLKACEEHIAQLLKLQNRNRTRIGPATASSAAAAAAGASSSKHGLSPAEVEHLLTSKSMLDNFVTERVEQARIKAQYQRKTAALQELNRELAQETTELDTLLKRDREISSLLPAASPDGEESGDDETFEDSQLSEEEAERRSQRRDVRLQIREVETSIERITHELDLLNADIADLSSRLHPDGNSSGKSPAAVDGTWEELGKEVMGGLSMPQCHVLLYEQLGDRAVLVEQLRVAQEELTDARVDLEAATRRVDVLSRQLAQTKDEMQEKLLSAEKQRVQDLWAMLKASESRRDSSSSVSSGKEGGSSDGEEPISSSGGGERNTGGASDASSTDSLVRASLGAANRVAIQRARDLEQELENCMDAEQLLRAKNDELSSQLSELQATVESLKLQSQLFQSTIDSSHIRGSGGSDGSSCIEESPSSLATPSSNALQCFRELSACWDALGTDSFDRSTTIRRIETAIAETRSQVVSEVSHLVSSLPLFWFSSVVLFGPDCLLRHRPAS